MALLRVMNGENKGKIYPLEQEKLVIGRESEEIPVIDQGVSRQHAEIFKIGELYFIRDLESRNGTFVNNTQVSDQEILRAGDRVHVGNTELVFEDRFAREMDSRILRFGDSIEKPDATISFSLDKLEDKLEETRQSSALDIVYRVSRHLGTSQDLAQALGAIAQEMASALRADHVYIFAFDEAAPDPTGPSDTDEFRVVAAYDAQPVEELLVSQSILRGIRKDARPILSSDAMLDDRFAAADSIMMKQIKSLLCVPLMVMNRPVGALYASNSKLSEVFKAEHLTLATTVGMMVGNAVEMHTVLERQGNLYRHVLTTIATATELRTPENKGRAERIANHASAIARGLGMPDDQARLLWIAGLLHDLGSLAMSESELKKAVNREQRKAKLSAELLEGLPELKAVVPAVRHHTERFDGSGFPDGLSENDIPLEAEVVGLACEFEEFLGHGGDSGGELPVKEALMRVGDLAGKKFSKKATNGLLIAYRRNLLFHEDQSLFSTGV